MDRPVRYREEGRSRNGTQLRPRGPALQRKCKDLSLRLRVWQLFRNLLRRHFGSGPALDPDKKVTSPAVHVHTHHHTTDPVPETPTGLQAMSPNQAAQEGPNDGGLARSARNCLVKALELPNPPSSPHFVNQRRVAGPREAAPHSAPHQGPTHPPKAREDERGTQYPIRGALLLCWQVFCNRKKAQRVACFRLHPANVTGHDNVNEQLRDAKPQQLEKKTRVQQPN